MPFLQRARSPNRPPLDSNPLPTDYETRTLTNPRPATNRQLFVEEDMLMNYFMDLVVVLVNIAHHRLPFNSLTTSILDQPLIG